MAFAVSATMYVRRCAPSRLRISAVAVYPSMTGIWQSMRTTSNAARSRASSAACPFSTASTS